MKTPQLPPPLPMSCYTVPTDKEKLDLQATKPLRSTKPQKPADDGLFDLGARRQTSLL